MFLVGQRGEIPSQSVRYTASDFCAELFSCSALQFHLIKHPSLFNYPTQYHIIHIIRRDILWVQAHALIFPRSRFSRFERDVIDAGFCLLLEVYFPSGHKLC